MRNIGGGGSDGFRGQQRYPLKKASGITSLYFRLIPEFTGNS